MTYCRQRTIFFLILLTFAIPFSDAYVSSNHSLLASTSLSPLFSSAEIDDDSKLSGPIVQPPRPNDNTYWISENFVAGEYPTDKRGELETRQKLRQYLDLGVNSFLDLTHEGEKLPYESILREEAGLKGFQVEYKRFPIEDFGIPTKSQMKAILDHLDDAIERNKKAYVHCRGGIGRTGTTVGCFLVRHGNSGDEALEELQRMFQSSRRSHENPTSPETAPQKAFVREWED
jgi:predicted protein tyrosine phosphatase